MMSSRGLRRPLFLKLLSSEGGETKIRKWLRDRGTPLVMLHTHHLVGLVYVMDLRAHHVSEKCWLMDVGFHKEDIYYGRRDLGHYNNSGTSLAVFGWTLIPHQHAIFSANQSYVITLVMDYLFVVNLLCSANAKQALRMHTTNYSLAIFQHPPYECNQALWLDFA
ncbi:hypothetical protein VNO78_13719 [Psophocarpus tetragonolobus]|uniref:Uncharacterized protein n=1 Tax=Psophocarpus tetragonolobus TaxID=3891 RepID=A0AAN9SRH3_PSOTE